MYVPDRAYGIETEYGCLLKRNEEIVSFPYEFLRKYLLCYADRGSCAIGSFSRLWGVNGSLTYIDTGDHPEHSSPEARSVRDAVIYSQAGDMLMRKLFENDNPTEFDVLLFKNNIARDENMVLRTFGCHENYFGYADEAAYNHPSFAPFLLTRQIFAGTGCWDESDVFFLSQRARALASVSGIPYAELPVKVKVDAGLRVHLTYGDSNMLDCAAFLKMGTTSLVLSLIEVGCMPDVRCHLTPIRDFARISQYGAQAPVILMESRGEVSALELQTMYWEAVRRKIAGAMFQSEEVAAESELIIRLWEQALNAIASNDRVWMLGRLDWATKQWLAEREIARSGTRDLYTARAIRNAVDLGYHLIMDPSMRERIHAQWPDRRLTTDAELEHATKNPPKGTRAQIRGATIRTVIEICRQHTIIIGWNVISFQSEQGHHIFHTMDPLNTYEDLSVSVQQCLRL